MAAQKGNAGAISTCRSSGGLLAGVRFLRALRRHHFYGGRNILAAPGAMSMAIYDAVQANDLARANELALILTSLGFGLLFLVIRLRQKAGENA
jgi:hypothetical protein